jgi:putative aminopeptidase FrvX
VAIWEGALPSSGRGPRALTAHVDTLGAMVKEIKGNGRLSITRIGGLLLPAVETEGCWVHSSKGEKMRGSLLVNTASAHVHGQKSLETKRDEDGMEIRLDARVKNVDEVKGLGVQVGDFVSFDPRVELTDGFIRSRFLDDKACVAAIVPRSSPWRTPANARPRPPTSTSATTRKWGTALRPASRPMCTSW